MSARAFEREHHFAHQTMIDAVAGTFERFPDRIADALAVEFLRQGMDLSGWLAEEYGGLSNYSMDEIYRVWRRLDRERFKDQFMIRPMPPFSPKPRNSSPMMEYIEVTAGSITGFSKKMKVPSVTVRRYARGVTKKMPEAVREAFDEIGYPFTDEMERLMGVWNQR